MELKTGYKQTEAGVIPSDWEVAILNDLAVKIGSGVTPTGGEAVYKKEGRPLVRSQNIGWGRLLLDDIAFIDDATHQTFPNTEIKHNDVFLNISGASIGRSSYANELLAGGNVNQHVCIIRTKDRVLHPIFLNLFLLSKNGQSQIDSLQSGGNRQGLNIGQIKNFQIPLPPTLSEQTAIATALSDTDQYITHLEKLIAKKRNIKQGAMQELLRPKEGWGVNTYGEIFDFLTTATYSRADLSDTGEIGYVHYGDIHTKWSSFLDFEKHKLPTISTHQLKTYSLLREGDIIMADASEDYSGVGESIEVKNLGSNKSIAGLHTLHLRDKKGVFVNGFKGYIHKSKVVKNQIEKLASGLKVYGISKHNLKTVQIPIPPIEEQIHIATILSDMDSEIATLEAKLSKALSIKQGMMQQLLTGKIRLT